MRKFILTGAPGAGKTAIIRQLEVDGFLVIEEAATDVIARLQVRGVAEPHRDPAFIDAIADLQTLREARASRWAGDVQFHDRSLVCTLALARFLDWPVSAAFSRELARVKAEAVFERRVFFIDNLGFVTPTAARRISFADAVRFEGVHEEVYRELGYDLVRVAPGSLRERAGAITDLVGSAAPLRV